MHMHDRGAQAHAATQVSRAQAMLQTQQHEHETTNAAARTSSCYAVMVRNTAATTATLIRARRCTAPPR
eukprot:3036450-Pleurochrysis_carterae.AAC.1